MLKDWPADEVCRAFARIAKGSSREHECDRTRASRVGTTRAAALPSLEGGSKGKPPHIQDESVGRSHRARPTLSLADAIPGRRDPWPMRSLAHAILTYATLAQGLWPKQLWLKQPPGAPAAWGGSCADAQARGATVWSQPVPLFSVQIQ
jgi:hypothetical protein